MGGGLLQRGFVRQIGGRRVGLGGGAGIVPQGQQPPHGHIGAPVGEGVHFLGLGQQVKDLRLGGRRAMGGGLVQVVQVGHAIVVIVDVEQLVIAGQVLMQLDHLLVPGLLAFGVALHLGHRVEHVKPGDGVLLPALHGRVGGSLPGGTAGQRQAEGQGGAKPPNPP